MQKSFSFCVKSVLFCWCLRACLVAIKLLTKVDCISFAIIHETWCIQRDCIEFSTYTLFISHSGLMQTSCSEILKINKVNQHIPGSCVPHIGWVNDVKNISKIGFIPNCNKLCLKFVRSLEDYTTVVTLLLHDSRTWAQYWVLAGNI